MTTTISSNVEAPQMPQIRMHSKMSSYTLLYKSQVAIHHQQQQQKSQGRRSRQEHQEGTEVEAMLKAAYKLTSQALFASFLIQLKASCLGMIPPTVGRPSISITH